MEKDLFFRKATLLICSSLDIDAALFRCREYIAGYLPADEIYLNIYEPDQGGLRYIARADENGGEKMEKSIKLPPDLIHSIESGKRLTDYMIINRPEQDPMGVIISEALNLTDHSFIALRLLIEGRRLGVIDLFARGRDRFSEEHANLFSLLREPFAIAMANVRELENAVERALIQHRHGPLRFKRPGSVAESREMNVPLSPRADLLSLDDMTRKYIEDVLALTNGRVNGPLGAAALLSVHPNTLRNRMKKLEIVFGRSFRSEEAKTPST